MAADRAEFEIVVLGGGPAGVTAALRARELGATVALVDRGNLGGTCTNDGCVPTRVLAHAARLRRDAAQYAAYGLRGAVPTVDFPRLLERTQEKVYAIHEKKQLRGHLAAAGVVVYANAGEAAFLDPHTIGLPDGRRIGGARIILCAGGQPRRLPFPGSEHALTHSDVWSLPALPASVAIVGGAATGCQLASVFAAFGAQVSLLEVAPRLVPGEDAAVSDALVAAFTARGIAVTTSIGGVADLAPAGSGYRLAWTAARKRQEREVAAVILAVGWPGNVESLDLAVAGVATARGYVVVNDALQTSVPHIYAAGDLTGRMMLVQSASGEGAVAAENAVRGAGGAYPHRIVPHGSFTDPEYASVGLTEAQARAAGEVRLGLAAFADLDRAVIDGRGEGFCKLLATADGERILGAHVVGEQAVEIVQIVAAGMAAGMAVRHLADLELSYPTYTAILGLAARALLRAGAADAPTPTQLTGAQWEWREA